jgi:hypothetical protein
MRKYLFPIVIISLILKGCFEEESVEMIAHPDFYIELVTKEGSLFLIVTIRFIIQIQSIAFPTDMN